MPYKVKSKGLDTCKYRRMRQQQMKYTTHILSRSPAYYRFISISITEAQAHPGSPVNQGFSRLLYIVAVIKIPVRLHKHQKSILIRAALRSTLQGLCTVQVAGDMLRPPLPPGSGLSAGSPSDKSAPFPQRLLTPLLMPMSRKGGT